MFMTLNWMAPWLGTRRPAADYQISFLSSILVHGTVSVRRLVSMHSSGHLIPGLQQQYIYREKTSVVAATGARGEDGLVPDGTTTTLHFFSLGRLPSGGGSQHSLRPLLGADRFRKRRGGV